MALVQPGAKKSSATGLAPEDTLARVLQPLNGAPRLKSQVAPSAVVDGITVSLKGPYSYP